MILPSALSYEPAAGSGPLPPPGLCHRHHRGLPSPGLPKCPTINAAVASLVSLRGMSEAS